jgi:hypothetical protein
MDTEIAIGIVELEEDVGLLERDLVVIVVACRRYCLRRLSGRLAGSCRLLQRIDGR